MSAEFGSDPWLDARLRDVPLPPGVLARLQQIAATPDEELDTMVRDVPVPPDLQARLSRISRVRRHALPWRELSLAAAVLIAVGISLVSIPVRLNERSTGDGSKFVHRGAGPAQHSGKPAVDGAGRQRELAAVPAVPGSVKSAIDEPRSADRSAPTRDAVASDNPDSPHPLSLQAAASSDVPADLATLDRSSPSDGEDRVDMTDDASAAAAPGHDGILTAPQGSDRLPRLETVNRTVNRGLAPPLVAGYDFLYQLKTGERPFVAPDAAPALATSSVPLIRDTSSYLLARESIAGGHLPPTDEVRIEDFLAAFDGLFPAATAPLVLHLHAGPAPFGEPGLQLLQVGLRAGDSTPNPSTGTPRVVARGATLNVAFNPKVVQAYRLVGHATTTLTGPIASITKVDLTAGSELAGLFELWLKPMGGDDVATAELLWNDPVGGAQRRVTGRIGRPQFAKSFGESATSLQAVALAAETARTLRSHAAPGRGLARVLDLAAQVQPQLRSQQSFDQLVQFVAQAERVRANPGAGARRAAADSQPQTP